MTLAGPAEETADVAPDAARGLGWTLLGRMVVTGANAAMMLALALWLLDAPTFGVFVTAVGAQLLLSRLVLAGADQAVIRLFTARSALTGEATIAAGYRSTMLLAVPVLAIGAIALAQILPPAAVLGASMGALGVAMFDLGISATLARLSYRRAGLLLSAMPSLRAILTIATAAVTTADSSWPVVVQGFVTLSFASVLLATPGTRPRARGASGDVLGLWRYSVWTGLADAAVMLALNFGVFLLAALDQKAEAGLLGFAMQFALGLFAVFLALYQALLPRAARLASVDELPAFLRGAWRTAGRLALGCAALAVLIGFAAPPLVARIRPDFAGFAPSFWALSAFMIVLVLEAPLGVTCHWLLRPRLQLLGLIVRCVAIAAIALWIAPTHGAFGAAIAQASGATIAALALTALVWNAVQDHRRRDACVAS